MAQNVSPLKVDDLTVVEMEVGPADGSAGDAKNHVVWLTYVWNRCLNDTNIPRTEPGKGLHCRAILARFVFWADNGGVVAHGLRYVRKQGQRGEISGHGVLPVYAHFERCLTLPA